MCIENNIKIIVYHYTSRCRHLLPLKRSIH